MTLWDTGGRTDTLGIGAGMSLLKSETPSTVERSTSKQYRPLASTGLKDDELGALYNLASVKKVAEGVAVAPADTQQDCCYVIINGSFRLVSPGAIANTFATLVRGEWFGQTGTSEALPYTAIAAEPSTVMEISHGAMLQLPPRVQAAVSSALSNSTLRGFRSLADAAQQANQKVEVLSQYTHAVAEKRIALTKTFIDRYMSTIPKLPRHANDLAMKLLNDRTTPQEVAEGVKRDPSLAALVLQTVNSPYYGLRTQILDYYRACLLLGFNNIYRLVLDQSLQGMMPQTEESRAIQEHSYAVSLLSHEIAKVSEKVAAPTSVTVGLLHDVGKTIVLLLKQQHPEVASSFALLDSSAVGASVLASWKLPEGIVRVVEQQSRAAYTPPANIPQEYRNSSAVLYLAHACFDELGGNVDERAPEMFTNEYLAQLGFPSSSLKTFYLEKVYPGIREQKCLPEPVRKMLSIE